MSERENKRDSGGGGGESVFKGKSSEKDNSCDLTFFLN